MQPTAIVVGAGPGGLAVARGLLSAGHHVRVYERSGDLRLEGAAVTLYPNGTAVLTALGMPLDGLGPRIDVLDTRTARGRSVLQVDTARLSAKYRTPTVSVPRRALVQRLFALLPAGTVAFDKTCQSVDPVTGRVAFTDGTSAEADVDIGADGHSSAVRRALRPDAVTHPTGWVTWQGLSRVPIDVTGSARIVLMLGRAGLLGLQPAGDGLLQWYFSVPPGPSSEPATGPGASAALPVSPVEMLRERFGDWADPVPVVLAAIGDTAATPWPHHSLPVPKTWGAERVTLLGDAAHTMPPNLAQGVNQTLEDAHALTQALGQAGSEIDPVPALRRYETVRAKQLKRIVAMTRRESSTTYGPLLMHAVPDRVAAALYARLIEASSPSGRNRSTDHVGQSFGPRQAGRRSLLGTIALTAARAKGRHGVKREPERQGEVGNDR